MDVVYFIQCEDGGPIKIGTSGDLASRLRALRKECPSEPRVLVTAPGGRSLERKLHRTLHQHRVGGEWFAPHPDVLNAVAAYATRDLGERMRALAVLFDEAAA